MLNDTFCKNFWGGEGVLFEKMRMKIHGRLRVGGESNPWKQCRPQVAHATGAYQDLRRFARLDD